MLTTNHETNLFYDAIAAYYDHFHRDVRAAMQREGAQLRALLREFNVTSVLDASCGTGLQSVPLAKLGFSVTASDPSPAMLQKATENAASFGVTDKMRFVQADFLSLPTATKAMDTPFDAVITKGDALTHLISDADLSAALRNLAALLRPDGVLVVGIRDYDFMLEDRIRFVPGQFHDEPDEQIMTYEIRDFEDSDPVTVRFNTFIVTGINADYQVRKHSVLHRALTGEALESLLTDCGFNLIRVEAQAWENVYICRKLSGG